ncbi:MFS transporter [Caldalkalibacillus salinus]|uniref:MFS transporter n=1 Tax=Caldalkalibacillus salinus TaxID=2803787 RepID=UPI001921286E|nr:MFS transporter [Caldalkalibacillus salinus]
MESVANTTNQANEHVEWDQATKRKIVFLLCIILFFSVMNGTMFMIAVPDIQAHYQLLPSEVSWVVTGYIILYAVGALIYGKLADIYPLKKLIVIGLILFSTGSILGFLAPNYVTVVAARMVQATGAAAIPALGFIIPSRYFPNEKGRVLGVISSTMAFASGIGPVMGGFIVGVLSWQYLFLVSVLVLVTVPFFQKWMPDEEKKVGKVDMPGAGLIAAGVTTLILFITTFQWEYLLLSLIFFVLFAWQIRRSDDPFIRPDVFTNVPFRTTILAGFLGIFAMFSMMFMLPLFLSEVNHLDAMHIGFVLFPGAMGAALIGRLAGRLTDQYGSRRIVYLALGLMVTGFFLLSTFAGTPPWLVSIVLIVSYIAFPFLQTSTANLLSTVLPKERIGIGMGIYNLCNFMSGAFAGAIIGKMLDLNQTKMLLNPIAQADGVAMIYSNIFVGLVMLTVLNGAYFYLVFRKIDV